MGTTTSEISQELWSIDEPCYIFHQNLLIENIDLMREAFTKYYGNFQIAYSFKTNYLKRIIETVRNKNCLAEVVSPEERMYAEYCGYEGRDIVYNGVITDARGKLLIMFCGGMVNVDNLNELNHIVEVVERVKPVKPYGIGIRVNFSIGNGFVSRFGISIDGDDFRKAIETISKCKYLYLRGFHCHIGSSRPPEYWVKKIETMIALAKNADNEIEYIDIGGGFYGRMPFELMEQFSGHSGDDIFSVYGDIIGRTMKEAFPKEDVKLIVEPGTALVGNTMDVLANVTDIKEVEGSCYITTDTNSNSLGVICDIKNIPVEVIRRGSGDGAYITDATIAGDTCLEFDYLKKGFNGRIDVGDKLLFKNVGAYSISSSRQFITPRMAVVDADTMEVLREREGIDDMFRKYVSYSESDA